MLTIKNALLLTHILCYIYGHHQLMAAKGWKQLWNAVVKVVTNSAKGMPASHHRLLPNHACTRMHCDFMSKAKFTLLF